jgi:hypothetical protein
VPVCSIPLRVFTPQECREELLTFQATVLEQLSAGVLSDPDKSLTTKEPVIAVCRRTAFQTNSITIGLDILFETDDPDALISYVSDPHARFTACDPVTGRAHASGWRFIPMTALPLFNPLNYTTLPAHILTHYASGYAELLLRETVDLVFLKLLASSSVPIGETLAAFHVTPPQLVDHILALVLEGSEIFESGTLE